MTAHELAEKWIDEYGDCNHETRSYALTALLESIWDAAEQATLKAVNSSADHLEYNINYIHIDSRDSFNPKHLEIERLTDTICTDFNMQP